MTVSRLAVIVFPGGFNLPLWVGQTKGFFGDETFEIALTPTRDSVFQLTRLIAGGFDLAITAMDNVVAYQEGQGEAAVEGEPDLFAFMGGDGGFLRLVVQPDVRSYADLRGRTLSVDALTTGFAFVLRKMLARGGLREGEYTLVSAGGVRERWEALEAGRHAGTLLLTPYELLAESTGFRRLGNAVDVLGRYQGHLGAARRSWARSHAAELVGFIRAYRRSLAWLFDPTNRAEAIEILTRHVPEVPRDLAAHACEVFLAPVGGFQPAAAIDVDGVRTVLELRGEYGRPPKALTDPTRYYDLSYYERAGRPPPT